MADICEKKFLFGDQRCVRPASHLGLHRDTSRIRYETIQWGDNESEEQ